MRRLPIIISLFPRWGEYFRRQDTTLLQRYRPPMRRAAPADFGLCRPLAYDDAMRIYYDEKCRRKSDDTKRGRNAFLLLPNLLTGEDARFAWLAVAMTRLAVLVSIGDAKMRFGAAYMGASALDAPRYRAGERPR